MMQDTRPPVGSTGTLAELQVQLGDVVRFETGHEYAITRVADGFDVDFVAKRTRLGDVGDEVTINNARECWTLISRADPDHPAHIVTHDGLIYDLTKLETPFGLLPEPMQEALRQWPHGLEMMSYSGNMVSYENPYPKGKPGAVWRAKPAPQPVEQVLYWGPDRRETHKLTITTLDGKIVNVDWEPLP